MLVLALVIGIVAGLRAMMAPAAIAWAASRGGLALDPTWLSFLGWRFSPWILTLLAIGELVTDKLPTTPSRKVPVQFGARLISGGICGLAVGYGIEVPFVGMLLGIIGAVIGTLGGAVVRARLAAAFGSDRPAALIEDAVAIGGAMVVFLAL